MNGYTVEAKSPACGDWTADAFDPELYMITPPHISCEEASPDDRIRSADQ
jgi:hypothetical protein